MVSLTEYAFRALMGSNVNPSQFLPRSVDHQGSTGENGAVVLAGEDSEYYFRGLNVLNGEVVKGGNAIETARFLAKLSSLGAIILFATPIDTVVDVAALTYYSFKWVKSAALQHTEERGRLRLKTYQTGLVNSVFTSLFSLPLFLVVIMQKIKLHQIQAHF